MDIEKADFALLNAVSEDEWAAYLLAGDASTETIMNKPSHGLSPDELSLHFFNLWSAGLIECSAASSGNQVTPDLQRARDQFVRTENWPPSDDLCLVYRLSQSGGDTWEQFAHPDWNKYLVSSAGDQNPHEWTLTGTNRDLVQHWRDLGSNFDAGFPFPLAGTERWELLQPWQATYWKTLPIGHRLKFFTSWGRPVSSPPSSEEVEEVFRFQREIWGGWHEKFDVICREHFGDLSS